MYIMGENPILSDPDQHHVEATLQKLEFLVVQDIFLTETAQYADVVLPATSTLEKDGTFTNTERRIQRVRKALEPADGVFPDWRIVQLVANRMGAGWDYGSPEDIMDEIATVTPQYGGVTFGRLEEHVIPDVEFDQEDTCGLQWPCPSEDHPGTPILHAQQFARGKGLFSAIEWVEPFEPTDEEYPIVLTTGRELVHYHTGTMTRQAPGLNGLVPEGRLELSPEDAKALAIVNGDRVRVTSRRGSIEPVAWVTDRVSPGLVFMPFHFAEAPANRLTVTELDPIAMIPELKVAAVHVEKVE
jgi:formate dehydrogenase major subunit